MQINQSTLKALTIGYTALFVKALNGSEPIWPKLAMKTTSTNAEEVYKWLGAMPGMKELIGAVIIENLSASDFSIKNKEYESTIEIPRADIERDSYGLYNTVMESLGEVAAQHPDELLADLMSEGFSAKDYTGKNFYDAAKKHEPGNKKSATFSNKSTLPLTSDNYGTVKAILKSMKNAHGRSMKIGKNLQLVVPPALENIAKTILRAVLVDGGDTNIHSGTAELVVFPDLATDTEWHLLEVGQPIKPFIVQEEVAPELSSQTDTSSDKVFLEKKFPYQAYRRGGAGYGLPQFAIGSTGAG